MKRNISVVSFLFLFMLSSVNVFASQDQDMFKFNINGFNNQRDSDGRFRDDYDNSSPWSVYVSDSTECSTCYTTFWLEDYSGGNISSSINVAELNRKTQSPYSKASRKDNYLTAEDNSIATAKYTVSGNWDEEYTK